MGSSLRTKAAAIAATVLITVLIEVFIVHFQKFAVEVAIASQAWGKTHYPDLLWDMSELLGPEPRVLSFVAIGLFARDGLEARRLLILRFCAQYLRWVLGVSLQEPRPSWIDPRVEMLHCPVTFGLPSGHATISWVVFVPLAFRANSGWFPKALFVGWFSLMCFGRVYLGTHSTHDLFLAMVIGMCLVYVIDKPLVQTMTKAYSVSDAKGLIALVFVLFGLTFSMVWNTFFRSISNTHDIQIWEQRAIQNKCSRFYLFTTKESVSAFLAFTGVLTAIYFDRLELGSRSMRIGAIGLFIFTKYVLDNPALAEANVVSGILYAVTSYMIFDRASGNDSTNRPVSSKVSFGGDVEYGTISAAVEETNTAH